MKTLKETVKILLDEAGTDVINGFFNSEAPEINKWTDEGSDEEIFVNMGKELNIEYTYEDSYGGEGEGETYWSVYKFTKGIESVYVEFNGSYQSYDGSTFDEWYFVEPKVVLVTQFFKLK